VKVLVTVMVVVDGGVAHEIVIKVEVASAYAGRGMVVVVGFFAGPE